ncbi:MULTISPECIES: acyl-CoA carboxylase epsilon subunit [unclassified Streptomyces]|uniref:acyl-CoA carboxylase epsilon subunit n=1 Tax=unclassified Streptomyces TaxID=2593676 RepID=UPI002E348A58|nr:MULTISPECIES: acyl-CoA carboxylase epsilon subunit [unclassified Streptomyces]WUC69095.1 acyl-CoA carboxylase subunit epsilon [Streptomyces sp. NBC_00539]
MTRHDPGRFVREVEGRPDTDELAALTAVVLARAAAHEGQYGGTAGAGPAPANRHRLRRDRTAGRAHTWREDPAAPRPA